MTGQWVHAPETLLQAYAMGVFPMAENAAAEEIRFYQPEERALLPLDPPHIPRRLRRTVRLVPADVRLPAWQLEL